MPSAVCACGYVYGMSSSERCDPAVTAWLLGEDCQTAFDAFLPVLSASVCEGVDAGAVGFECVYLMLGEAGLTVSDVNAQAVAYKFLAYAFTAVV